ncbi:MAG: radical SAM family heme chaperone HemW [Paramuribaculum sp.]|nr:radical SAM family heme chaperone HemW [Paramuribaculum sp.]MDE6304105.1 radical SAM family heme chaperone HemW [Paramuribaculum sp.]
MAGLYIHIPFCHSKCIYCDFYSVASSSKAEEYVGALFNEWQSRRDELRGESVETVYLGGGTPSILPLPQLDRLLDALPLAEAGEVTIEVNPEDVTDDFVALIGERGINRVSMGVQTLCDSELKAIGRRHSALQAMEAVETLRRGGIDNLSLDLMFGLPGQSVGSLKKSVESLLALKPEHLSAYLLSYEPATRLTLLRDRGEITEASEEIATEMYRLVCDALGSAGYDHYEISNYSLPGRHSRHNSAYWIGVPYLGLGPGAHSFNGSERSYNPSNLNAYLRAQGLPERETELLTEEDRFNEALMLGLRTSHGIDLEKLRRYFPEHEVSSMLSRARKFIDRGLMTLTPSALSVPEPNWLLTDSLLPTLFT